VRSSLHEAVRLRGGQQAIFAYTWYDTQQGRAPWHGGNAWQTIVRPKQLDVEFGEPRRLLTRPGDGLVVWGTSTDAGVYVRPNSSAKARCREMAVYLNTTLGPYLRALGLGQPGQNRTDHRALEHAPRLKIDEPSSDLADAFRQIAALRDMMAIMPHAATAAAAAARHGVFVVMDYGADPSGINDSTAGIQAAIWDATYVSFLDQVG
jgi:hypothetical protein